MRLTFRYVIEKGEISLRDKKVNFNQISFSFSFSFSVKCKKDSSRDCWQFPFHCIRFGSASQLGGLEAIDDISSEDGMC